MKNPLKPRATVQQETPVADMNVIGAAQPMQAAKPGMMKRLSGFAHKHPYLSTVAALAAVFVVTASAFPGIALLSAGGIVFTMGAAASRGSFSSSQTKESRLKKRLKSLLSGQAALERQQASIAKRLEANAALQEQTRAQLRDILAEGRAALQGQQGRLDQELASLEAMTPAFNGTAAVSAPAAAQPAAAPVQNAPTL